MNCPSRTEPEVDPTWNQSPNAMASDLTTRSDLDKIASARLREDHKLDKHSEPTIALRLIADPEASSASNDGHGGGCAGQMLERTLGVGNDIAGSRPPSLPRRPQSRRQRFFHWLWKCLKFVGPGFMIAVAYIDPGNYATDAAAGASYQFKLLFMVLLSCIFAIFLQALAIKLSTVTGLNLAEMNKAHLPPWLNYTLWFFGEAAVIATDLAEVIGFAIALNLLAPSVPVVAGCAISILDVMFILMFYRPDGGMKMLRVFEFFIMLLVIGVAICFCYQLSLIKNTSIGEVFQGFLPSSALVQGEGLYQACGILGATVMPHSLYLGSGLNQPRLRDYDQRHGHYPSPSVRLTADSDSDDNSSISDKRYRPSLPAIQHCMKISIWELAISLGTFALFINCAILIVCGASLSSVSGAQNADLFGIYDLLQQQVAPVAGTVFAVALLMSGCSAGIVCTMAGQMISEGQLHWKCKPWVTRLLTRSISIIPAILVAGTLGRDGLSTALVGSQVALSVILPVVSAPLIVYTSLNKYMTVVPGDRRGSGSRGGVIVDNGADATTLATADDARIPMRNHLLITALALVIWLIIVVMNVADIVLAALGVE